MVVNTWFFKLFPKNLSNNTRVPRLYAPNQVYFLICFQEGEVFYVPNCFTPDGDEYNNVFTPIFYSGYDPYNFELLIFDCWGELIFESKDVTTGWDGSYSLKGRKAHDGTYKWKSSFKNAINDKRRVVTGHVNLLR